jgi:F0F1-type ATP synthase membrane subunit c/vacuolar-type H+-ATPase subunit K
MEQTMDPQAAKLIGAGLAAIGLGGVGVGIGNVFATTIATIGRNPSIQNRVAGLMWVGFALVEAIGLFALLVAFMVLFG